LTDLTPGGDIPFCCGDLAENEEIGERHPDVFILWCLGILTCKPFIQGRQNKLITNFLIYLTIEF